MDVVDLVDQVDEVDHLLLMTALHDACNQDSLWIFQIVHFVHYVHFVHSDQANEVIGPSL